MKIILSRKGFDSASGGGPSPILPDGRLISLPIPDSASPVRYRDLRAAGRELGPFIESFTRGKIQAGSRAHLDPDLVASWRKRPQGFQAALGQCGAAARHLEHEGVGPGDLFLFFGWFRQAEMQRRRWVFERAAPDRHILFGWLEVDRVVSAEDVSGGRLASHPHLFGRRPRPNRLFLATRKLRALGEPLEVRGAGIFRDAPSHRVLTAPGATRSDWLMPHWCRPRRGNVPLTYHRDATRYRRVRGGTRLRSAARGQEFVLDTEHYPEAIAWARSLFRA